MPTLAGLNWFDLILIVFLGFGLTVGYTQGLLRQLIGIAALYVATILAAQYFISLTNFLRTIFFLQDTRLLNATAFFIILLGISGVVNLLARDAYRMTKIKMLPLIDQLGGSILGLITMVILITLILPILFFVTAEPLPYFDATRVTIAQGMLTSRLVPIFGLLKPTLLNAINPWIPGGLPSIFNL